ncbi:MAG TPA: hypothetical protein DDW94_11785 [Deltaproteobacteria bacterium]|nr:MAG: hypothetical protein A2Z79_05340 [Deltaproteobacteria bacterium GWA2_55_82]OGQ63702.1 MAG: hypothetical protein A3I81_08315 [Deltaproteobacteria bacterium RIFCSPLOWO2_02_FULL_55_12]OIJ72740.1 MAG: hypothetical protein A2V21_312920 [Deltaproteobacteria bacterium GWC2_55_46]HBG47650.1 hypothetical protein [Deltaproteobacteria bacterium]HCY10561.1 hypothetical protein [Deltaproteobacteria bacterium]
MRKLFSAIICFFVLTGISVAEEAAELSASKAKLVEIRGMLDEVAVLKEKNDSVWQPKVYKAFNELKKVYTAEIDNAEMYLLFARSYHYNDRRNKALTTLKKVFYFDPTNVEGLMLKGDIFFDDLKKMDSFADRSLSIEKQNGLEQYEAALKAPGISKETEAMIYLRIGDLYELTSEKGKAQEAWSKAVSAAPGSASALKSEEKLNKLKK